MEIYTISMFIGVISAGSASAMVALKKLLTNMGLKHLKQYPFLMNAITILIAMLLSLGILIFPNNPSLGKILLIGLISGLAAIGNYESLVNTLRGFLLKGNDSTPKTRNINQNKF